MTATQLSLEPPRVPSSRSPEVEDTGTSLTGLRSGPRVVLDSVGPRAASVSGIAREAGLLPVAVERHLHVLAESGLVSEGEEGWVRV